MTRDEAKREIDSLDFYLQNHTDDYGEESHMAMMMAIKALEQQTCEDAVSRQAVLDIFADNADAIRPYSKTWEEVKALPSVNPQPKTKTGHWIDCGSYYRCSECDNWVDEVDGMPKFCDECGAKMVEPQERSEE